jgi:medium-chain acyl-[acyl-carrier-protein] hydrolase
MFHSWSNKLPEQVELIALRLPGRDSRIGEAAFSQWTPLLSAIKQALVPYLDQPFAFFGHSLGASLAYELTRKLHDQKNLLPRQLIISGCRCPHLPRRKPPLYNLPKQEFFESLRQMNGIPLEVFENTEIMALVEPTLRADIKLAETWEGNREQPLNVPITAFSGLEDEIVPPADMKGWEHYTNKEFSFHTFPGDHFFVHSSEEMLLNTLTSQLFSF